VTPRPELAQVLGIEPGHEICRPATVITPIRDYEDAFEGCKRAWMTKAKEDFIGEFLTTWSADFPGFAEQLRQTENFDRWWSMSEVDVIEIESGWKPS
jgi:hypothetical protein